MLVQIAKLLHRFGKQNIAIRGKTDERSNFSVFLHAQAEHDPILGEHLKNIELKRKATGKQVKGAYISHRIQEELIGLIGDFLEDRILNRLKKAIFFAIMADECRDASGEEKMALFFRYVYFDENTGLFSVHEDFVQFLHCERTSGEALYNVLMEYVTRKGIRMEHGRGQGYDGGGNMSGIRSGLQARIKATYPKMPFVWCHGHCLNLCLTKACEGTVKKVVDHVQEITIAFKYSAKRQQIFKESIAGNPAKAENLGKKQKLVMLSETRWSARGESFSTIKDGIVPLVTSLETLEALGDEKANGRATVVIQLYFVVTVCIVAPVLTITAILSSKLQYGTLDIRMMQVATQIFSRNSSRLGLMSKQANQYKTCATLNSYTKRQGTLLWWWELKRPGHEQ